MDLVCVKMCNLDICFELSVTQEIPRDLYPKEATLDRELLLPLAGPDEHIIGNGPRVYRDVMGLDCWPGHPVQTRLHEVWPLVLTTWVLFRYQEHPS